MCFSNILDLWLANSLDVEPAVTEGCFYVQKSNTVWLALISIYVALLFPAKQLHSDLFFWFLEPC